MLEDEVWDIVNQKLAEMERKKHADAERRRATISAATSGGVTGSVLGGAGALLSGKRGIGQLIKGAAKGALMSAPLAGGSIYLGQTVLGPNEDEDPAAMTRRGAIGGGLGGALVGGTLGALAGRFGLPKLLAKSKTLQRVGAELPLDNVIVDKLKSLAATPGRDSAIKGGLLGGGTLGGAAAYLGSDEGMQLDAINNAMLDRMKRQRAAAGAY